MTKQLPCWPGQFVVWKVGGAVKPCSGLKVGGGRVHSPIDLENTPSPQMVRRIVGDPQGDVRAPVGHVHFLVRNQKFHANIGMRLAEIHQITRQHGVGKTARRGKAHNAVGISVPAAYTPVDRLERAGDTKADLAHFIARVRQHKPAFDTIEQTRARLFFKQGNVPEDRRMAQPGKLGGANLRGCFANSKKHFDEVPVQIPTNFISKMQYDFSIVHISIFFANEYPQFISTTALKDMDMIGYTSLGTANLSRAESFYDALLAEFGAKQVMRMDDFIVWAAENGGAAFSIHVPENGKEYSVGNGVMIALAATSQTQVNLVHEKALKLGAGDEGKPGFRAEGFYAAYFRDLDGNKLNVHCMVS